MEAPRSTQGSGNSSKQSNANGLSAGREVGAGCREGLGRSPRLTSWCPAPHAPPHSGRRPCIPAGDFLSPVSVKSSSRQKGQLVQRPWIGTEPWQLGMDSLVPKQSLCLSLCLRNKGWPVVW